MPLGARLLAALPVPARVIVLSHPKWWLDHVDELTDALATAAALRERQERVQETEQRQPVEPEHTWVDLATLRRAREQWPPPPNDPSRDCGIGR